MGKPVTLLERICEHVLSFHGESIDVEHKEDAEWVFAHLKGEKIRIAKFPSSGRDAEELLRDLQAAKKPFRAILGGQVMIVKVDVCEERGEGEFAVTMEPVPKPDPSVKPAFTKKQGQYLAFIYTYIKIHRQAPSEPDLERYFRVSAPSIHDMIKTLHRNGLIERTPGQARSIRLVVQPEHLPRLE